MPVDIEDVHLGTAAQLLMEQGKQEAAALLLDVQSIEYINMDLLFPLGAGDVGEYVKATAKLFVEPSLLPRFTDEIMQQVAKALYEAALSAEYVVDNVLLVPAHAAENWRESRTAALGDKPANQETHG